MLYLAKMDYKIYNANTITNEKDYLEELANVRLKGYAVDNEEEMSGVICIGAPVMNYHGYPCGSIWISGPKDRLPEESIIMYARCIMQAAEEISFEMGYTKD